MPKLIDHSAREIVVAEAAWRVLLRDGITKISVRNVAAEAGLATGSLRRSFPTQDALLAFSLELVRTRARERILSLPPAPTARERAENYLMQLLPLDADRRVEMEVYYSIGALALASQTLRPVYESVLASTREVCARVLHFLVADGSLDASGLDLDREAAALHALVDGLAAHLLVRTDASAPRILADYMDRLTRAGAHAAQGVSDGNDEKS